MKKTLFLLATLMIANATFSQKVNYKVLKDAPSKPANILVNLDLLQLDLSENYEGSSMNIGVWGMVDVANIIEIDYKIQKAWFNIAGLRSTYKDSVVSNFDLEGGVTFYLLNSEKTKNIPVVLNVDEGFKLTTTTTLHVPGTINKRTSARGGLIFKRNTYEDQKFFSKLHPMNRMGMYGGMSFDRFVNLYIDADGYGKCSNSTASRMYLDILYTPYNSVSLNYREKDIPFGWRAGYQIFQAFPRSDTGKRFGLSTDVQLGYRPYTGYYMTVSVGITIVKK